MGGPVGATQCGVWWLESDLLRPRLLVATASALRAAFRGVRSADSGLLRLTLVALPTPYPLTLSHRGDYSQATDDRPIVTIAFAAVDAFGVLLGATTAGVLVDSGARTACSGNIAPRLGLDLSRPEFQRAKEEESFPARFSGVPTPSLRSNCAADGLISPSGFSLDPVP